MLEQVLAVPRFRRQVRPLLDAHSGLPPGPMRTAMLSKPLGSPEMHCQEFAAGAGAAVVVGILLADAATAALLLRLGQRTQLLLLATLASVTLLPEQVMQKDVPGSLVTLLAWSLNTQPSTS